MHAPWEMGTVMHQQREGHILVLLECPETEAGAGPSLSPIVDLLHVLGWAATILRAWVSVGLSSSNFHGRASSSHMPWVAAHTAVTVGWKSILGHGPAVASLGSGGLRHLLRGEMPGGHGSCRGLDSWAVGQITLRTLERRKEA